MKTIKQTYVINGSAEKVWRALVNSSDINGWGGGPAKMTDKVGENFTLWGGDIHGKNLEVVPHQKLKQEWYAHYDTPSFVTFTLTEKDGKIRVDLLHEDVPNDKYKSIDEGWKEYYMIPLKKYVESK